MRRSHGFPGQAPRLPLRVTLGVLIACLVAVSCAQLGLGPPAARAATKPASSGAGAEFVATQGRVLDTRAASQVGAYRSRMYANSWRTVQVSGHAGVPAGAVAVTVSFTAVDPSGPGVLHAAPAGVADPTTSTSFLNFVTHRTQSNSAVVGLGADGAITVATTSGTDLLVDVQGYYTAGSPTAGGYVPLTATRMVDTRSGLGVPRRALSSGRSVTVHVTGTANLAPVGASAVMLNLTVLNRSTTPGYLTAYLAGSTKPGTSINFPGTTAPTAIGAQVGLATSGAQAGSFTVQMNATTADLLVDVVGYFVAGGSGGAFTPGNARVFDSRAAGNMAIPANSVAAVRVAGVGPLPTADDGLQAVTTDTAVIAPAGHSGYLRVWADGQREPTTTSSINFGPGITGNMLTTAVGTDGDIYIRNVSASSVNVVIDAEGWYTAPSAPTAALHTLRGLDMHDGTIVQNDGTYYMYGTEYGCGFTWGTHNTPFCGFGVRTASSLSGPWSTSRLLFSPSATIHEFATGPSTWTGDNGKTWSALCGGTGRGCFNPRMIQRPDGAWVLWFNSPADYYAHQNSYWSVGCNGPLGPCGSSAGAPFGTDHKPTLVPCADDGDFTILTSGSAAAIICSQGTLSQEMLDANWTNGTGEGTHQIPLAGVVSAEGVGGFQRDDGTWEITYSDPQCGYCSGPPNYGTAGGATQVQTGYATAPTLNGTWTAQGVLSSDYCTGQPRTVFTADGQPYEWIDQWTGSRNETEAPIKLEAMNSSPWSCS